MTDATAIPRTLDSNYTLWSNGFAAKPDIPAANSEQGWPTGEDAIDVSDELPPGLSTQTRVSAASVLSANSGDPEATATLQKLIHSEAFRNLPDDRQQQALALFGGTNKVSSRARQDLTEPRLSSSFELTKYLMTEAHPADFYRDNAMEKGGVAKRLTSTVSDPKPIDYAYDSSETPGQTETKPSLRYEVQIDGRTIEVIMPAPEAQDPSKSYPDINEIARGLAAMPQASLEATKKVVVMPLARTENDNGVIKPSEAPMYAGEGIITVNPPKAIASPGKNDGPRDQRSFDTTFLHESAHLVQQPDKSAWNKAVQQDSIFSTFYADDNYLVEDSNPWIDTSGDPGEDFAETYMIYHLVKGTPDEAQMHALMPERFAILDRMFPPTMSAQAEADWGWRL